MANIQIVEEAEDEYSKALVWYSNRSVQAAEGLETEFRESLEAIASNPDRYPKCDEQHRFYLSISGHLP